MVLLRLASIMIAVRGDLLAIPRVMSWIDWAVLGLLALLGILIVIRKLMPRQPGPDELVPFIRFWSSYRKDRVHVDDIVFQGLSWTIEAPALSPPDREDSSAIHTPDLHVRKSPRCPKCSFVIQESQFKGGFVWKCTACDFQKISRSSFYETAERIRNLARRAWEMSREQRRRKGEWPLIK